MSGALAEALVAAQRRALHAVEKAYVNGNIDKDDAAAILDSIGGCDDLVDRGYLFKALDTIKLFGATLPTERPANGALEAKASAAQLARIRRDLEARGLPMLAEACRCWPRPADAGRGRCGAADETARLGNDRRARLRPTTIRAHGTCRSSGNRSPHLRTVWRDLRCSYREQF